MKAFISDITIKNYRSCINTKVQLRQGLTVLIGKNGAGKTNVLNALQLIKRGTRRAYYREKGSAAALRNATIVVNYHEEENSYLIKFDIAYDTRDKNEDLVYRMNISLKKEGKNSWGSKIDYESVSTLLDLKRRFNNTDDNNYKFSFADFKRIAGIVGEERDIEIISHAINYFHKIKYFGATQFSDPSLCPIVLEVEDAKSRKPYGYGDPHYQFVYDLYKLSIDNKLLFEAYVELISDQGMNLIQGIDFKAQKIESTSYEVKSGGEYKDIKRDKLIIIPYVSLDGLNLSFNQLSEGTFKTMALTFYILQSGNEMLLIEEPEVSVHHGLLSMIIELIQVQSTDKQIIVSTHSDYLLDKLEPEDLLLISKKIDKGTEVIPLTKKLSANDFKALKLYLSEVGNLGEYWKESGL